MKHHHHRMQSVPRLWLAHFVLGFIILLLGMMSNGGTRKYIPLRNVNLNRLQPQDFDITQGICSKAYVNVFATSHDEPDAWVCCDGFDTSANALDNTNYGYTYFSYKTLLCHPWSKRLPFAKALTDFPFLWILPVIPILLRIIWDVFRMLYPRSTQNKSRLRLLDSTRRLIFFHLIMQFRGWGLYVFLEKVEDILILYLNSGPTTFPSSVYDGQRSLVTQPSSLDVATQSETEATCWYSSLRVSATTNADAQAAHTRPCKGQEFDFSDHVVYFYTHVLPLLLFEALFCFLHPFWEEETVESVMEDSDAPCPSEKEKLMSTSTVSSTTVPPLQAIKNTISSTVGGQSIHHHHHRQHVTIHSLLSHVVHIHMELLHFVVQLLFHWIIPPLLVVAFMYFNFLTFLAVYTTAAVYHTVREVIVGYAISLVVQIPLGIILCTDQLSTVRSLVGISSTQISFSDNKVEESEKST